MEMPKQQAGLLQSVDAKPRMKWTRQLHGRFVDAVSRLGGADKATPKSVMRVMGIPGLTLYHLKSHLQKYRLARIHLDHNNEHKWQAGYMAADRQNGTALDVDDNLARPHLIFKMQMEGERKLQEQIEVQEHLQLRIEAQGKYLQSVLKLAQQTLMELDVATDAVRSELDISTVETEHETSSSASSLSQVRQGSREDGEYSPTESCLTCDDDVQEEMLDTKSCKQGRRSSDGNAMDASGDDSQEEDMGSKGMGTTTTTTAAAVAATTSGEPPLQRRDLDLNR